jgi:hypothetical protein
MSGAQDMSNATCGFETGLVSQKVKEAHVDTRCVGGNKVPWGPAPLWRFLYKRPSLHVFSVGTNFVLVAGCVFGTRAGVVYGSGAIRHLHDCLLDKDQAVILGPH